MKRETALCRGRFYYAVKSQDFLKNSGALSSSFLNGHKLSNALTAQGKTPLECREELKYVYGASITLTAVHSSPYLTRVMRDSISLLPNDNSPFFS